MWSAMIRRRREKGTTLSPGAGEYGGTLKDAVPPRTRIASARPEGATAPRIPALDGVMAPGGIAGVRGAASAEAGAAGVELPAAARVTSSWVMRPWAPLPLRLAESTPSSRASLRVAGLAEGGSLAAAGASAGADTAGADTAGADTAGADTAGADAPEADAVLGAAAGAAATATPPLALSSISQSGAPIARVSPSFARILVTTPAVGDGISLSVLSVRHERLLSLDALAFLDQPLAHRAFDHALAERGYVHDRRHLCFLLQRATTCRPMPSLPAPHIE